VIGAFLQRRVKTPVITLLRQGITPDKMALCLALGVGIGVFPILGTTTAILTIVALTLRLNLVAIQVANYVTYPLQILLIIPFLRIGEWLVGAPPLPLSVTQIVERFDGGFWNGITTLATSLLHAALGWLVVVPAVTVGIYVGLRPVLRRMAATYASRGMATPL
jgi:uncharacterized protein (DUF2062 family)